MRQTLQLERLITLLEYSATAGHVVPVDQLNHAKGQSKQARNRSAQTLTKPSLPNIQIDDASGVLDKRPVGPALLRTSGMCFRHITYGSLKDRIGNDHGGLTTKVEAAIQLCNAAET